MLKNKNIKILLILLSLVLAAGAVGFYINQRSTAENSEDSINYDPPTQSELEETEKHKEELTKKDQEGEGQSSGSDSTNEENDVKPVITFLGQSSPGENFELNGYVPGVIEEDGNCTVILTKGSVEVEESKKALPDAQSTSCGLISIPRERLSAGEWTAQLKYESSLSSGISASEKVTIK